jgi:hypothetical protein
MRDRTASRNYSPARDEFRREHERHREWGLRQRHGRRLMHLRIYGESAAPADRPSNDQAAEPPGARRLPMATSNGDVPSGREFTHGRDAEERTVHPADGTASASNTAAGRQDAVVSADDDTFAPAAAPLHQRSAAERDPQTTATETTDQHPASGPARHTTTTPAADQDLLTTPTTDADQDRHNAPTAAAGQEASAVHAEPGERVGRLERANGVEFDAIGSGRPVGCNRGTEPVTPSIPRLRSLGWHCLSGPAPPAGRLGAARAAGSGRRPRSSRCHGRASPSPGADPRAGASLRRADRPPDGRKPGDGERRGQLVNHDRNSCVRGGSEGSAPIEAHHQNGSVRGEAVAHPPRPTLGIDQRCVVRPLAVTVECDGPRNTW